MIIKKENYLRIIKCVFGNCKFYPIFMVAQVAWFALQNGIANNSSDLKNNLYLFHSLSMCCEGKFVYYFIILLQEKAKMQIESRASIRPRSSN